jgi:transcription initiation factor IIE alpha subunit
MSKETIQIVCEGCDSEYKVTFDTAMTDGMPDMCCFCGNPIDLDTEEHDVDDDSDTDEDEDTNWG